MRAKHLTSDMYLWEFEFRTAVSQPTECKGCIPWTKRRLRKSGLSCISPPVRCSWVCHKECVCVHRHNQREWRDPNRQFSPKREQKDIPVYIHYSTILIIHIRNMVNSTHENLLLTHNCTFLSAKNFSLYTSYFPPPSVFNEDCIALIPKSYLS